MLLVQRGADLNKQDRNKHHPLFLACISSCEDLFEYLIRHGSDPALAEGLSVAAVGADRTDILQYLQGSGINLDLPNARGIRPIEAAIGMGNLTTVEYLLSLNVDISSIDVSKPLVPGKGALPGPGVMDQIRERIKAKKSAGDGAADSTPPHG